MGAKVVDFGCATWADQRLTEDVQTRQYRAPEVRGGTARVGVTPLACAPCCAPLWAASRASSRGQDPLQPAGTRPLQARPKCLPTPPNPSPLQVILGAGYDDSADIWSLACMVFELVSAGPGECVCRVLLPAWPLPARLPASIKWRRSGAGGRVPPAAPQLARLPGCSRVVARSTPAPSRPSAACLHSAPSGSVYNGSTGRAHASMRAPRAPRGLPGFMRVPYSMPQRLPCPAAPPPPTSTITRPPGHRAHSPCTPITPPPITRHAHKSPRSPR